MGFDLSRDSTAEAAEAGSEMQVRDASGAIMEGVTITVAGADSERVKRIQRQTWNTRRNMGGRRNVLPTAEEAEEDSLKVAVAATLAWCGFEDGGSTIDCTPQNIAKVYKAAPFIRKQVEAHRDDEANFTKTP